MDFHALSRKDLQTLCKKNSIRANMTNAAMADALQALELVEGIEDIQLDTMTEAADVDQESPKGESVRSKNVPRTCGRTSTRRKSIKENGLKEPEETPILSSARTQRGAAVKASNVRRRICKEEDEEKEDNVDLPTTLAEDNGSEVPKTPATRNGRNRAMGAGTSARKGAESHTREEKENQNPVDRGLRTYSTRRSTRLSGKILQEAPPTIGRSRGRREAVKIMALSVESEESGKESKEGSKKSNAHAEEERGASNEHVSKDLDQDPSSVVAEAAPVFRKEDIAGGNEAAVLELPLPSESFDQGDQESIEEDLEAAKLALESKEREEKPIESSKAEDNAAVIEVEAASNGNEAAGYGSSGNEASPSPPPVQSCNLESKNCDMDPPAVFSSAENDDSELDPDTTTDTDWELHRKNIIDGTPGKGPTESSIAENPTLVQEESRHEADADEVSGHDSKNIEGGSSCIAADEILVDQGCEEGDAGHDTDDGVLPEGMVDQVPEDDAVDVPVQYAEDPAVESLALRLQENLTLKRNPDMEEESATDGGKSSSYIIGYPIPVSEICYPNADQDIGLKASAEESDDVGDECNLYADASLHLGGESATCFSDEVPPPEEDVESATDFSSDEVESDDDGDECDLDADAGLHLRGESATDFSSEEVPPPEEGVESATDFSSDQVPPPEEGVESATDFSSEQVPPLEDTMEGDNLSPSQEIRLKSIIVAAIENPVVEGRSSSLEQTLTDSSFGEATTGDSGVDRSFSENPDHISDAFQIDSLSLSIDHVTSKTPASLRPNGLITSDSSKISGNKSNKSRRLSLSNKKTPIKSRIFEDADKENKTDGAEGAKREGKEFGSLSKVKKMIVLIEDVNTGEDSRQKSLKKKSMRQLKRMVKEKINAVNTNESLGKRSPLQALSENRLSRNEDN